MLHMSTDLLSFPHKLHGYAGCTSEYRTFLTVWYLFLATAATDVDLLRTTNNWRFVLKDSSTSSLVTDGVSKPSNSSSVYILLYTSSVRNESARHTFCWQPNMIFGCPGLWLKEDSTRTRCRIFFVAATRSGSFLTDHTANFALVHFLHNAKFHFLAILLFQNAFWSLFSSICRFRVLSPTCLLWFVSLASAGAKQLMGRVPCTL